MPSKEDIWRKKRVGLITASELSNIVSASGKIIDGNISYIRSKRWERKHGFSHPVSSRPMEIGNEQEPMAVEWLRANTGIKDIVYSKELSEIPLWTSTSCPMGASPDAYTRDESIVFEIKTNVSPAVIEFFNDEYTSYEEKKAVVWKDHGDQILGQFISNPRVNEIWLLRYTYQDDDIMADTDSPIAPWRGIIFKFARKDYEQSLADMKERIWLFDAFIDAPINPADFKVGEWFLESGELKQRIPEKKKKD